MAGISYTSALLENLKTAGDLRAQAKLAHSKARRLHGGIPEFHGRAPLNAQAPLSVKLLLLPGKAAINVVTDFCTEATEQFLFVPIIFRAFRAAFRGKQPLLL